MTTRPFVFSGEVTNCFDSHVHWPSTGHWQRRLSLHALRSAEDLRQTKISPHHYEGKWLLGYGWDQNLFTDKQFPTRAILDELFPDQPVCFTRVDGHAVWVNTVALKLAGTWQKDAQAPSGGLIMLGDDGWPTGILIDGALQIVRAVLPKNSLASVRLDLLAGQKAFHKAGFTHIRDLTCDADQWTVARELEKSSELKMAVEVFFGEYKPELFTRTLSLIETVRHEPSKLLRVKGMKVFYDGALGSEGALLSEPYRNCKQVNYGLRLIEPALLREILIACHKSQIELAVHVIGDQAAHEVVTVAHELRQENRLWKFHLEHAELLRPETLSLLNGLPVTCHFQPCHWLSDKKWLQEKIGPLFAHAFRWRAVGELGLPLFFGSDSPIEESCLSRSGEAVLDAARAQIPVPVRDWTHYHSHPDHNWVPCTVSRFVQGSVAEILFGGERLVVPT